MIFFHIVSNLLDESLDPTILRIGSRSTKGWKSLNGWRTRYDAILTRAWGCRGDPHVGQELAKPIGGMGRQSFQDVFEVSERIDLMTLARSHQAVQGCRRPAPSITPYEQVVLAPDGLRTHTPFRDVVVDAQLTIAGIGLEILPLVSCIRNRLADRALGKDSSALLIQPAARPSAFDDGTVRCRIT